MKLTKDLILAWVSRHFPDYKVRKGGQEIVMANPWGDSGQHFNIGLIEKTIGIGDQARKGFWVHDWRPGHQGHDGSFFKLVQQYKGVGWVDAVKEVCGAHVDPRQWLIVNRKEELIKSEKVEGEIKLPASARRIDVKADLTAYKMGVNYLASRAISLEEACRRQIHYDSMSIIFPYIEFGIVVYWQSRSFFGKKFEFPPSEIGVTKSEFIYGFDDVDPDVDLIVCEHIIDSINIGPGAVGIGGATLSQKQVKKIKILKPNSIILAADNDKPDSHGIRPGIASIGINYKLLEPYYQVYYSIPPDPYKDWNDMAVKGIDTKKAIEDSKKPINLKTLIALRNIR